MGKIKDVFNAYIFKNTKLVSKEEYPLLEYKYISRELPKNIIPFDKIKYCKIPKETYVCFYCQDKNFLKVIKNPKNFLGVLRKFDGIIGLDFSIYTDMPKIQQKYNIMVNLSITEYFAEQGIKIIPNIRFGTESTFEDYKEAIPRNTFLAIGTYGSIKTKKQKNIWLDVIIKIIEEFEPRGIIVYGSLPIEVKNIITMYGVQYYIYEPIIKKELREYKLKKSIE
jgi:hypothetical protein